MFDKDWLCRAALYPKFSADGHFDEELMLDLVKEDDGAKYALSLASVFILEHRHSSGAVHGYGCRTAQAANSRFIEKNGREPLPYREQVHYLGFYKFQKGKIKLLNLEHYDVSIRWLEENGEDAHFQLEFHRNMVGGTGKAADRLRRKDRLAAIGILATFLVGPFRHICSYDEAHRDILENIQLDRLPRFEPKTEH